MTGKLPTAEGLAWLRKHKPLKDLAGLQVGRALLTSKVGRPPEPAQEWVASAPPELVPFNFLPEVLVREVTVTGPSAYQARKDAAPLLQCDTEEITLRKV